MASNEYHFVTEWRVPGSVAEVMQVIRDERGLPRWWPSVYLDVKQLNPGDERGLGKVVDLYTKGWLPYSLRWQFRVTEVHPLDFTLVASGDFVGRSIWSFRQAGPDVIVIYDWKISAEKPLLRYFSPIMKPIFGANHRWAMARGEESLLLELARRRAPDEHARALIPAPLPATRLPVPLLVIGLFSAAAVLWMVSRRRAH